VGRSPLLLISGGGVGRRPRWAGVSSGSADAASDEVSLLSYWKPTIGEKNETHL